MDFTHSQPQFKEYAAASSTPPETADFGLPPIIGVLCIDVSKKLSEIYGEQIKSYIAASYVKFLEAAGARVIPIWIAKDRQYYEEIMSKINGILLPGGAVFLESKYNAANMHNDCVESSRLIYEIANEMNDRGEYFPLWGTCLGLELLMKHTAQGIDVRQDCENMKCALPIKFEEDFEQSRMFAELKTDLKDIMQREPFAHHYHRYCITKNDLQQFKIQHLWQVLASNRDACDLEFISLVEHRIYPYFGSQFHPERVCYEYCDKDLPLSHSSACLSASMYLANFFVKCCRRSSNRFGSYQEELRHLIWNFRLEFTGRYGTHWMQCYLFEQDVSYPNLFLGAGVHNELLRK